MTRADHLRWAKDRALEYVDAGELSQAQASMGSDLNKHPETTGHPGIKLWMGLALIGRMQSPAEVRDFIEGFN